MFALPSDATDVINAADGIDGRGGGVWLEAADGEGIFEPHGLDASVDW